MNCAEAAERQRVAAIKEEIEEFKALVIDASMGTAERAQLVLETALRIEIDDSFGEFYGDAVEAKAVAVAKLKEIVEAKQRAEAEAARIKAEQDAEAARLAAERERMDAERAELERQRAELSAQQAAAKAEQDRIAAEEIRAIDAARKAGQAKAAAEVLAALPKAAESTGEIPLVEQKQAVADVSDINVGDILFKLFEFCTF